MRIKKGRRPRSLRPPVKPAPHETWEFIFNRPVSKDFETFLRVWALRGASEEDINEAILIAAMKTNISYDQKPQYVSGIIKHTLKAREDALR